MLRHSQREPIGTATFIRSCIARDLEGKSGRIFQQLDREFYERMETVLHREGHKKIPGVALETRSELHIIIIITNFYKRYLYSLKGVCLITLSFYVLYAPNNATDSYANSQSHSATEMFRFKPSNHYEGLNTCHQFSSADSVSPTLFPSFNPCNVLCSTSNEYPLTNKLVISAAPHNAHITTQIIFKESA